MTNLVQDRLEVQQMDNKAGIKILPVQQKVIAYTSSLMLREFFAQAPALADIIRHRYQEVRIPLEEQTFFIDYPDPLNFVAVIHEESPDTVVTLPILMRVAHSSPRFTLRILRDTDDLSLIAALVDEFDLNNDLVEIDLPLLLIFDEEWNYQGHWGPHPQAAEPYLDSWFEQHQEYVSLAEDETLAGHDQYLALLDQLTHEMRVWYNSGLNGACAQEIRELLASFVEEVEAEE